MEAKDHGDIVKFIDLSRQRERLEPDLSNRIGRVLDHARFILGPEVAELEDKLAGYTGAAHCITVANGTDALQIALMAADVGPGDEVITPGFTYVATCEAAVVLGAAPVFVEIDPRTYCIDPEAVDAAITPRTKAVIAVSLYGQCAGMETLAALCKERGILLIEDAAQSFGATQHGERSCNLGDVATTSFFPTKPLGCYGDGGAVFTSETELAERIRRIARHGQSQRYHHDMVGVNSRLDTVQAAVLLAKLEIIDNEIARRQEVGARYDDLLRRIGVEPLYVAQENTCVYAQYTIRVPNRAAVMAHMKEQAGIPTMVHYPLSLHHQPAYAREITLPRCEAAAGTVMSLPMHPYLTAEEQNRVVDALGRALEKDALVG